jgi:hypothetical protein
MATSTKGFKIMTANGDFFKEQDGKKNIIVPVSTSAGRMMQNIRSALSQHGHKVGFITGIAYNGRRGGEAVHVDLTHDPNTGHVKASEINVDEIHGKSVTICFGASRKEPIQATNTGRGPLKPTDTPPRSPVADPREQILSSVLNALGIQKPKSGSWAGAVYGNGTDGTRKDFGPAPQPPRSTSANPVQPQPRAERKQQQQTRPPRRRSEAPPQVPVVDAVRSLAESATTPGALEPEQLTTIIELAKILDDPALRESLLYQKRGWKIVTASPLGSNHCWLTSVLQSVLNRSVSREEADKFRNGR